MPCLRVMDRYEELAAKPITAPKAIPIGTRHDRAEAVTSRAGRTVSFACGLPVCATAELYSSLTIFINWRSRRVSIWSLVQICEAVSHHANRAHAWLRSPGERANVQLKTWLILRKLRRCPWRAGQLTKAIHTLRVHEAKLPKSAEKAQSLGSNSAFAGSLSSGCPFLLGLRRPLAYGQSFGLHMPVSLLVGESLPVSRGGADVTPVPA